MLLVYSTGDYEISDTDDLGDPKYFGYVKSNGHWKIMKQNTDGTYRYARGISGYQTFWADRASLGYSYYQEAF